MNTGNLGISRISRLRGLTGNIKILTIFIIVLAMIISLLQYNMVYITSYVSAEFIDFGDENFRRMDFENGSMKLLIHMAEQWNISSGDAAAAVMLMNHYSCNIRVLESADEQSVKRFIRKMYRFYPEEFRKLSDIYNNLFEDAQYAVFPIPLSTDIHRKWVKYVDSWGYERTYGGARSHEGCDIMALDNIRGEYPVISVSSGTVVNKGWLEKGGYRIGVLSDNGIYYYYAHLASYAQATDEGSRVECGTLLGFMGDTGYSKVEGTTGKFDVHLHMGIYIYENDNEISINPYPFLKMYEGRLMQYNY